MRERCLTGERKGQEIALLQDPLGGAMTRILVTIAAIFVLIGPASAQEPGAAGNTGAAGAQTSPTPGKSDTGHVASPKLRDQLLQGAINVLLQPRPKRKPPEAAPPPVMVIPVPPAVIEPAVEAPAQVAPEPSPPPPLPASVAVTPAVVAATAPSPAITPAKPTQVPRPEPRVEQPPTLEPAAPPPLVQPPQPALPVAVAPQPPVIESAEPISTPVIAPSESTSGKYIWLLLGLLAAIVIAAAALSLRRARQIARTRAALSLNPSLDPLAGACSANGLALAGPSLAIRARLDLSEALRG